VDNRDYVFVDSCILLDIFNADESWGEWSANTLHKLSDKYQLVVNIIVFTEISFNFTSSSKLKDTLELLNIDILDIPLDAAFNVSRTFKKYRKNKGDKKAPMPDFYIGEHAKALGAPLVTRDIARFKTYQPKLKLITPEKMKH